MAHVKRVMFAIVAMFMMLSPFQLASATPSGASYLHVAEGTEGDYFQFDERGVFVPQTDPPAALKEGWIVLSGQEPVTITGPFLTIVLQRESILTIGTTVSRNPAFYLVAGSASFLVKPPFTGTFEVSTPVGIYRLDGPGELFISSDYAELVFSLGGEVKVMNAITRQVTDIPPFTYLNLADPFLNAKQISRQTFETLSINPEKTIARALPSASVTDGLTFQAPKPIFPEQQASVEVAPVETVAQVSPPPQATPLTTEGEKELAAQEIPVDQRITSEGITLTISVPDEVVPVPVPEASVAPVKAVETVAEVKPVEPETFDVHIVHTNDVLGQMDESGIGFARLATLLRWGRSLSDRNLLLDAGNTTSGTPLAEAFAGETVAVLLDMLAYDAIAPGEADYAYGLERLVEAAKAASRFSTVKVLAANILDEAGNALFEPYGVFDLNGFEVGVIGISMPGAAVKNIQYFNDLIVSQAQALVDEVAAKSDYVILLGNIGSDGPVDSTTIASSIDGIDLIIDGVDANVGERGKLVGKTLIVNAGERLSSVGLVHLQVTGDTVSDAVAHRIDVRDVEDPETSALAKAYGVTYVPEDAQVASYIAMQKEEYLASLRQESPAVLPPEPVVTVAAEEPAVSVPAAVYETDPLAIKGPQGIVGADSGVPAPATDWGVSASFDISRDGIRGSSLPKIGISINPFFHHNSFAIGLQAFFLTDGSLFSPSTYDVFTLRQGGGTAAMVSSAMRFIDYVRFGREEDTLYVLADDKTPIDFGNRLLVNSLAVASGPFEEHLGVHGKAKFGRFALEGYADDLYLSNWLEGDAQSGGLRFSFDAGDAVTLGLSSVLTAAPSGQMAAYPAFDLLWRIRNERRLGLDLLFGMATLFDIDAPSFASIVDVNGSSVSTMFPNFLMAIGADIRTLSWNFRFIGAAQNSNDGDQLVSLGAFNATNWSGRRMLDTNEGIHFVLGAEAGYQGNKLGATGSWHVPVKSDLSGLVPLAGNPAISGDILAVEATYSDDSVVAALGFRRVGFLSAFSNLFDFSGGFSGFLANTVTFIKGEGNLGNAQPYFSLRYTKGLFSIEGEFGIAKAATSYVPRINLGATVTVGKNALAEALDPDLSQTVLLRKTKDESGRLSVSADMSTAFTRTIVLGGTDENHLTVKPVVTISAGDGFSLGIGPKLTVDLSDTSLYSHDDSPFKFGSTYAGTIGKVFDASTDLLGLIDHLSIGSDDASFKVRLGGDQDIVMGPLVRNVSTRTDNVLEDSIALTSSLDTDRLDLGFFVNDLSEMQLGGFRIGIAPFKSYGADLGLSAIGNIDMKDSNKRAHVIPGIDLSLPLVSTERMKLGVRGAFATLVGYDTASSFKQMFYTSGGSFLSNLDNYIINGGMDLAIGSFGMSGDLAMQEGALSYGMFNPLFIRERSASVLPTLDGAWTGASVARSYTAEGSLRWTKERLSVEGSYLLPISASFAPVFSKDLLSFSGSLDLSWFDLSLSYTRKGFASAAKALLTDSSVAITTRAKNFLVSSDSAIGAKLAVRQGPLTFNAELSNLALFAPVAGSWNAQSVVGATANPAFTVGVDINLF